jgi:hypothetical protein
VPSEAIVFIVIPDLTGETFQPQDRSNARSGYGTLQYPKSRTTCHNETNYLTRFEFAHSLFPLLIHQRRGPELHIQIVCSQIQRTD